VKQLLKSSNIMTKNYSLPTKLIGPVVGLMLMTGNLLGANAPTKPPTLDQRVAALETAVSALQTQVAAQQSTINAQQTAITALQSSNGELVSRLQ
jgi:hypothetical protein